MGSIAPDATLYASDGIGNASRERRDIDLGMPQIATEHDARDAQKTQTAFPRLRLQERGERALDEGRDTQGTV